VFVFSPSTDVRLVSRLKQICSQEGILSVASSSLSALSQASGGDVRSAINTLQFAAMRAQAQVQANSSHTTAAGAASAFQKTLGTMITSGLKDERQDVFQLWSQIFSFKEAAAKFSKKFQLLTGGNSSDDDSACGGSRGNTHAMRVLDTILGYNDHQLVLSGVQENYLSVKYTDPNLIKTSSAADWLSVGNVFEGNL
jgi:DNA polymerase III delta prime subunit